MNCFGIIHDGKAEQVDIKVFNDDKKDRYFQSLPLHHSQNIKERTEDYTISQYYLQPTFDFRQEILSHGAEIEVLSPKWLREEIAVIVNASAKPLWDCPTFWGHFMEGSEIFCQCADKRATARGYSYEDEPLPSRDYYNQLFSTF